MSFPVLTAHQIYPYFFQLGGRLSPISIRDQMVRGQLLVEQAFHAGLIGGNDRRPLLVVGAGAAGATVALAAARLGVPTLMVDEGAAPFRLQAGCRTRLLDPAHYDWPLEHWDNHHYPWPIGTPFPRTPLPWPRDFSHRVATNWLFQFNIAARRLPRLHVLFTTIAHPLGYHAGRWTFQLLASGPTWPPTLLRTVNVGMVVWTVGFGNETSRVAPSSHCNHAPTPFHGFPFWSSDPYAHPTYRLPATVKPKIVISGAGDGGLQDFLRVVVKPQYQAAGDLVRHLAVPPAEVSDLLHFEERAQRAYHWGDRAMTGWNGYDHAVLETIHNEHLRRARLVARAPGMAGKINDCLRDELPELHLIHDCNHFPNVYPLNRFLVLLLAEHINLPDLILPRRRVLEVNSADPARHVCTSSHIACHGEDHEVMLVNAPYCLYPFDPRASVIQSLDSNAVIIRHGIDARTLRPPHLPDIPLTRQLPPYHVH